MTWTLRSSGLDDLVLDPDEGYAVVGYDLGFPEIREVADLNADGDGETDLTAYHGARLVTLDVRVLGDAPAERQQRAMTLRRFMAPNVRVELLWDPVYGPVRMLGRPDRFSAQVGEAMTRQIARCGWRISNGLIESQELHSDIVWPGTSSTAGRTYDLTFDRQYPAGTIPGASLITVAGTARSWPLMRIFGPGVNPTVQIVTTGARWDFTANGGLTINAGDWVDIDCYARTALLNSAAGSSVFSKVDMSTLAWGALLPGVNDVRFNVASGASAATQMQVIYRDAWY